MYETVSGRRWKLTWESGTSLASLLKSYLTHFKQVYEQINIDIIITASLIRILL